MTTQLDSMIFGDGEADDVPVIDPLEKLLFSPPSATDPEVERRLLDAHSFAKADAMFKAQQARPMSDAGTLSKVDDGADDDLDVLAKRDGGADAEGHTALMKLLDGIGEPNYQVDKPALKKIVRGLLDQAVAAEVVA